MSGTIHLIVEGQNDADIVKAILRKKYPNVRVSPLYPPGNPSLAQLAKHIEKLIRQAISNRKRGDCIAVLHDKDLLSDTERNHHSYIEKICQQYSKDVKHIQAADEIESWLLADSGLCLWLSQSNRFKPDNWDNKRKPSEELASRLKRSGVEYRIQNLSKILRYIEGDGDQHSPSLQKALTHLHNAPCTKT